MMNLRNYITEKLVISKDLKRIKEIRRNKTAAIDKIYSICKKCFTDLYHFNRDLWFMSCYDEHKIGIKENYNNVWFVEITLELVNPTDSIIKSIEDFIADGLSDILERKNIVSNKVGKNDTKFRIYFYDPE